MIAFTGRNLLLNFEVWHPTPILRQQVIMLPQYTATDSSQSKYLSIWCLSNIYDEKASIHTDSYMEIAMVLRQNIRSLRDCPHTIKISGLSFPDGFNECSTLMSAGLRLIL